MVRGRAERGEQLSGVRAAGVAVGERPSFHRSNGNSECVTSVWVEWGLLFIMTEGHVVYLLREKANTDKLAILYERKLYPLALALSESWGIRDHDLSDIHQQYAS